MTSHAHKLILHVFVSIDIQSNSVITNSSGPAKCFVQAPGFVITRIHYNQVDLCRKWSFGTDTFVHYNRVFVITEFVITLLHCIFFPFKSVTSFMDDLLSIIKIVVIVFLLLFGLPVILSLNVGTNLASSNHFLG